MMACEGVTEPNEKLLSDLLPLEGRRGGEEKERDVGHRSW